MPVGNTKNVTLTYRTKKYSANVSVVVEGNKNWGIATETAKLACNPQENIFLVNEGAVLSMNSQENIFVVDEEADLSLNNEINTVTLTENAELEIIP